MVLYVTNFLKRLYIDTEHALYTAPCIIVKSRYFLPKLSYNLNNTLFANYDITPYSHPLLWKKYSPYIENRQTCDGKATDLSLEHIAAAKGAYSLLWSTTDYHLTCGTTNQYIKPHALAYFFNHPWPYEKYVNTNDFLRSHFVSLFFKMAMDFHTFVFPKNSAAWKCYRYVNQIRRKTLKQIMCRAKLENEICSLIDELYDVNWRLFYHMYTFKKISKYLDFGSNYPFDTIAYIQRVRSKCQTRRGLHSFLQVNAFYKLRIHIDKACNNKRQTVNSTWCLRRISYVSKQIKYINYQIQSILHMYFPLTYMIYHEFFAEFPNLASKNTMEIVQIMHAYGFAPFFHNNPVYNYWNVLNSSFSNPFRTMTHSILKSDISEIISWIQKQQFDGNDHFTDNHVDTDYMHSDPLTLYKNLTLPEHDSADDDMF